MACCGQSSPLNRPPVVPKSYRTTGLNPATGSIGQAQPLTSQPQGQTQPATPPKPTRTVV